MIQRNSSEFSSIILQSMLWTTMLVFGAGILYSVFGIDGFMREHLGWLGPHLFGAAINLNETGIIAAERVYENGDISPYGHHPPFSFYLFNRVAALGETRGAQLALGYFVSAVIVLGGWFAIFRVLISLNIEKSIALISVIVVSSANLFLMYRSLLSFDAFSILISAALLYAFTLVELRGNQSRNLIIAASLLSFSILVSYYAYLLIAVFLLGQLAWKFYLKQVWAPVFFIGLTVGAVALIQFGWIATTLLASSSLDSIGMFVDRVATDQVTEIKPHLKDPSAVWASHSRQISRLMPNSLLLNGLLLLVLGGIGVAGVRYALTKPRRLNLPKVWTDRSSQPWFSIFSMFAGIVLFLYIARYWATNHPFALLMLAAPGAYLVSLALSAASILPRHLTMLAALLFSFFSFNLYSDQRRLDLAEAKKTKGVLALFDYEFNDGYAFSAVRACGPFNLNNGMQKFLYASPNVWSTKKYLTAPERTVRIACHDSEKGIYSFETEDGNRKFLFVPGLPGYETIKDEE